MGHRMGDEARGKLEGGREGRWATVCRGTGMGGWGTGMGRRKGGKTSACDLYPSRGEAENAIWDERKRPIRTRGIALLGRGVAPGQARVPLGRAAGLAIVGRWATEY